MKTSTSLSLLSLSFFALTACQKETRVAPENINVSSVASVATTQDTIPDKACFKIKLVKDSMNYDETAIVFDHTAGTVYNSSWDAIYFTGFGNESLSSLSSDGRALAIYRLPYAQGMSISLELHAKADSKFYLETSFQDNIPANIQIWLKDSFLNDSLNIGTTNYNFTVSKTDTATMGSKRFKLILKDIF
jgi:hypothetical protein